MKKLFAFLGMITIPAWSASAFIPLILGTVITTVAVTGFSIYRTLSPVDLEGALHFFTSCWTCGLFSGVFNELSSMIPGIYSALGVVIVPIAIGLTAIWVAWTVLATWMGVQKPDPSMSKPDDAWNFAGKFTTHLVKLIVVSAVLLAPLPRIITSVFIEPVFNIGLSISTTAAAYTTPAQANAFEACIVATAISDTIDNIGRAPGAFSPTMRYNLTCQLGGIHQMTGLGMTTGWAILNSAFEYQHMHKFLWFIPIFPNIPLLITGAFIVFLFFMALIPIPLYFLEVIIRLSMNLIMMPLFLLGWLFGGKSGWKIFPDGAGNIKDVVDQTIKDTVGIATVGVFVVFSVMFLTAMFGTFEGAPALKYALQTNDSGFLIESLLLQNDNRSVITIIMSGIFIAFFMTSIPAITQSLFKDIKVKDDYYKAAQKNATTAWDNTKKWYKSVSK
ncbi:MAG: hypothetical protein FWC83_00440 [Alphaproteobacteria bacterium]|nr:hypothetical protein [Alphaproteobacteria bacterium]